MDAKLSKRLERIEALVESNAGKLDKLLARKKAATTKPKDYSDAIPESLDTPEFRKAWSLWVSERRKRRNPLSDEAVRRQIKRLVEWGPSRAVMAIEASIEHGWTRLVEPKDGAGNDHQDADEWQLSGYQPG